jgi:FlaA1/EpsC-like NDP-sugar epimerase
MMIRKIASRIYQKVQNIVIARRLGVLALVLLAQAAFANYMAFLIRFDFVLPRVDFREFLSCLPLLLSFRLLLYFKYGMDKALLRYASIDDMVKIIKSATLGSCVFLVSVKFILFKMSYPSSVFILDWLLFIIISGGTRLSLRIFREYLYFPVGTKRILVIGAGDEGEMILRTMRDNVGRESEPIGILDDDAAKKGRTIHGIPVLGPVDSLPEAIAMHKPDEIFITVSTDTNNTIRKVYELSKEFHVPIKKLPGINDLLDGNVSVAAKLGQHMIQSGMVTEDQLQEALDLQKKEGGRLGSKLVKCGYLTDSQLMSCLNKYCGASYMKPISLEDLLQREPVRTDIELVRDLVKGKAVMITGAGGSIGSELSRQIHKYRPSQLILLDRYENSLYETDLELRDDENGSANIETVIADIQDAGDLDHVFSRYRPQIVFHAAAYKHVPLMEHNPIVAVKNNVFGTRNLLEAVVKYDAERFVMISTDKAVNPTSVMGATKRIAEFLTIRMNCNCRTKFTVVRFGNVLGTNGSVVPVFKEQLKKGGPLKVTHPEIKRFFMLIPEAVQLVLIASAAGNGGEIFVLDMGEQVKICDLAENFIRLSGFIPHKEIKIKFIGLRPGEKLYEELFDKSEKMAPTFHEKLNMALPEVPSLEVLNGHLAEFERCVNAYSSENVISEIRKIVPSFSGSCLPLQYSDPGMNGEDPKKVQFCECERLL